MNLVTLIGTITTDLDVKTTSSQIERLAFTVACQRKFKDKGTGKYQSDFVRCEAWRQQASFISQYFRKGSKIAIIGCITTGSYDGADGKRIYTTSVTVDKVEFVGEKNSGTVQSSGINLSDENFPASDNDSENSLPFDL